MKVILWYDTERVQQFVADRTGEDRYEDCQAIGLEENDQIIAGVVFTHYTGKNMLIHVASDGSRRWLTPAYLFACFHYAFESMGVNRLTGLVRADNKDALTFDRHLGFVYEGTMRAGANDGTDLHILGMLKQDCRFLADRYRNALLKTL